MSWSAKGEDGWKTAQVRTARLDPAVYSKVLRDDVATIREVTERWRRSGGKVINLTQGMVTLWQMRKVHPEGAMKMLRG